MIFSMPIEAMCSFGTLADKSGVALVGADHECPGLGDHEIGPRHARVGDRDQWAGRLPLCFRQIKVHIGVARVGADRM